MTVVQELVQVASNIRKDRERVNLDLRFVSGYSDNCFDQLHIYRLWGELSMSLIIMSISILPSTATSGIVIQAYLRVKLCSTDFVAHLLQRRERPYFHNMEGKSPYWSQLKGGNSKARLG